MYTSDICVFRRICHQPSCSVGHRMGEPTWELSAIFDVESGGLCIIVRGLGSFMPCDSMTLNHLFNHHPASASYVKLFSKRQILSNIFFCQKHPWAMKAMSRRRLLEHAVQVRESRQWSCAEYLCFADIDRGKKSIR